MNSILPLHYQLRLNNMEIKVGDILHADVYGQYVTVEILMIKKYWILGKRYWCRYAIKGGGYSTDWLPERKLIK